MSQPIVFLITSDPQLQYLISRYGEQSGCDVLSVDTVEQAMTLLAQTRPDSILLHLIASSVQNWESLRQLKAHPASTGLPVTVIAALADEARARDEGAAHWLWQPVMYADFLNALVATDVLAPSQE